MRTEVGGPPKSLSDMRIGLNPEACLKNAADSLRGVNLGDQTAQTTLDTLGSSAVVLLVEGVKVGRRCGWIREGQSCPFEAQFVSEIQRDSRESARTETIEVTSNNAPCLREPNR